MNRSALTVLVGALLLVGCAQPQMPLDPPQKPDPAAELARLEPLVGTWAGTAEMVEPSVEEMRKHLPEGAPEIPSTFEGQWKSEWVMGGMFLRMQGWHQMGEDQRMNFLEFYTWDPKVKKYRGLSMTDWGEYGRSWMELEQDGKTYEISAEYTDANGAAKRGRGEMILLDEDTLEWTWTEQGPHGKMKFKGTSRRQS